MKSFLCSVLAARVIAVKTDLSQLIAQVPVYSFAQVSSGQSPWDCWEGDFFGTAGRFVDGPRPV